MLAGSAAATSPQGVLALSIEDDSALYDAWMPFVRGGGIFVPTARRYGLGDEVLVSLSLMDEAERLPIAGKVVWITPPGAQGNRMAGIGVQFDASPECEAARGKIEAALAAMQGSERLTRTM
jgi:type IV pilus assembly protein PilZ